MQERDAANAERTIQDLIMNPDKLPASLKPSLEESLSGSRPDANNNERDKIIDHMKEDLWEVRKEVHDVRSLVQLLMLFMVILFLIVVQALARLHIS